LKPIEEYRTRGRRPRSSRWRVIAVCGALIIPAACVFDPDERCGPHEHTYAGAQRCVCDDGYVYTEDGCVECGAHEVPSSAGCVCEAGYSRPTSDGACEETPAALGAQCSDDSGCDDPYPHCELVDETNGYCTNTGCETSDDCDSGYACDTATDPTVCRRPPNGLGQSCQSDADCAGTEATYCDLFVTMGCLVQGCNLDADDCFTGYECCDLSGFGVPQPLCVSLAEGGCQTP
jgi:hypothetical protein